MHQNNTERILSEQQRRWLEGDRVSAEELIAAHAETAAGTEARLDLIYNEVLLRLDLGEQPVEAEYVRRFPELHEAIIRQFQIHGIVQDSVLAPEPASTVVSGATLDDSSGAGGIADYPQIPGFRLRAVAGRGGSGIVFRALDEKLSRIVAIKLVLGAETGIRRAQLIREAEAAASLKHPAIVDVYHVGETDGSPFLVMEYLAGGTLANRLRTAPLRVEQAAEIICKVAGALQHAHEHGVVHRDLKPGNVLLDLRGEPHVADFGLARRLDADQSLHTTGDLVGTPAYMAPEQARGEKANARSDVYSIGAVLYECLSGRPPFQAATTWDVIHQVVTSDAVPLRQLNPKIPQDLETVCQKCLEKDPSKRYAGANEVVDELERFREGRPIVARPLGRPERLVRWCRRNKSVAALASALAVLLVTLGVGSTIIAFDLAGKNKSIRAEQTRATKAEQRALSDRATTLKSLNRLVDSLYEDLSRNAATIKTREKVLNAAIDGLESLVQVEGDQQADETTIRAYRRLGELRSLKGQITECERDFDEAISIARKNLMQHPGDSVWTRELARSLTSLATHKAGIGKLTPSADLIDEAERVLGELLRTNPEDADVLEQLVALQAQRLDVKYSVPASHQAVLTLAPKALADTQRLLTVTNNNQASRALAARIHMRIGETHLAMRTLPQAARFFDDAAPHIDAAVEAQPQDPQLLTLKGDYENSMGRLQQEQGLFAEANASFTRASDIITPLSAAHPQNSRLRKMLAYIHRGRSRTLRLRGRYEEAIEADTLSITILHGLLQESPEDDAACTRIAAQQLDITSHYLALNDWPSAIRSLSKISEYLDGPAYGAPVATDHADSLRLIAAALSEGLSRASGFAVEEKTTSGECVALLFAARRATYETTSDALPDRALEWVRHVSPDLEFTTFAKLYEHVHQLEDVVPFVAFERKLFEVRAYAKQAEQLSFSGDEQNIQRATELTARAVEVLRQFVEKSPAAMGYARIDPDLLWLRTTSEYEALVSDLQQ